MLEFYWGCLTVGMIFAVVTIIFGDVLGDAFDGIFEFLSLEQLDFIEPMVIVGGITVFGGAGIMLSKYTSLEILPIAILAFIVAILLSMLIYFTYVKPMKNSENSSNFSVQDLIGKTGEVIVPIPSQGFGEIIIKIGAGNTNQIAGSLKGEEFSAGTRVIVAEVREDTLYVLRSEE